MARAIPCSTILKGADFTLAQRRDRRPGRSFGHRQVDAAACRGPAGASRRRRSHRQRSSLRRADRREAHGDPPAARSASSTSSTICCPEFRRLENIMMPQMIAGLARKEAARTRKAAARLYAHRPPRRAIVPASFRAASSSGSRLRARLPMRRPCFSPTSRPATSIPRPRATCSMRWRRSSASPVLQR